MRLFCMRKSFNPIAEACCATFLGLCVAGGVSEPKAGSSRAWWAAAGARARPLHAAVRFSLPRQKTSVLVAVAYTLSVALGSIYFPARQPHCLCTEGRCTDAHGRAGVGGSKPAPTLVHALNFCPGACMQADALLLTALLAGNQPFTPLTLVLDAGRMRRR